MSSLNCRLIFRASAQLVAGLLLGETQRVQLLIVNQKISAKVSLWGGEHGAVLPLWLSCWSVILSQVAEFPWAFFTVSKLPFPFCIVTFYSCFTLLHFLYFLVLPFVDSVWFLFRGFHLPALRIPVLKIDLSGQGVKLGTALPLKCSFWIQFFWHLHNVMCSWNVLPKSPKPSKYAREKAGFFSGSLHFNTVG